MVDIASVVQGLVSPGYLILPGAWLPDEVLALREEALAEWHDGAFHRAGVGRGDELEIRSEVRRDLVRWLAPSTAGPAAGRWWHFLEHLREELNRQLFLSLVESEAHFAVYPAGAFYHRHLDRFRDHDARTISCLLYLNDAWTAEDGGQLRIYPPGSHGSVAPPPVDTLPAGGTIVIFRSDTVEHEVLPAMRERLSLACWLRRRG